MYIEKTPEYVRVYNSIRSRILEGDYVIGELLPSEPELEKQYNVSRTTVRRAVEMLSREGFVEAKQGRGTKVLDFNTTQNINEVSSLSETLARRGYAVYSRNFHIDQIEASPRLARELELEPGEPVVRIQRIQMADDIPIAIFRNYLIPAFVPNIESYAGKITSLYNFLEDHYHLRIDAAKDLISARSASFEEAEMLRVPIHTALIYLVRICYSGGRIIGADHCRIIGSKYEFEVYMSGRSQRSSEER